MCFVTYDHMDPGWSFSGNGEGVVRNTGGALGAWLSDLLLFTFGYTAYLFPLIIIYVGWLVHNWQTAFRLFTLEVLLPRITGFLLIMLAGSGLATMHFYGDSLPQQQAGGVLGQAIKGLLIDVIGFWGATLLLLVFLLISTSLILAVSWLAVVDLTGMYTLRLYDRILKRIDTWEDKREGEKIKIQRQEAVKNYTTGTPGKTSPGNRGATQATTDR